MEKLIKTERDGTFSVPGVDMSRLSPYLYGVICKLKDYEKIGMSPDELQYRLGLEGEKHTRAQAFRRMDDEEIAYVLRDDDFFCGMCANCPFSESVEDGSMEWCHSDNRDRDCHAAFVKFLGELPEVGKDD